MPFWNVQNALLAAFEKENSLSISKRDFHLNSTHDTWSDPFMDPSVYGTILHSMALYNAGGQIRRVARDSIPYTCMEFIQWYGWDLGRTRWNEASPWSVNSTRLAEVLRQSRAPGIMRLQASYTERPSALLESMLEYQFGVLC
jgi:predicted anti-sigma-YlaC factor YlaD